MSWGGGKKRAKSREKNEAAGNSEALEVTGDEKTLSEDFAPSAAKGAEQTRQQQREVLARKQENAADLAPIQDAVKSLSQISGVKISFEMDDRGNYLCGKLIGCNIDYGVFVGGDTGGYKIWRLQSSDIRDNPEYEGKGKTLKNALQSIAMIAGLNYPDQATEIDRVINEAIDKSQNPGAAKPSSGRTVQGLRPQQQQ